MSGRSSIERLPGAVRDAVDAAVEDGATIDEITASIRAHGVDCSRAAVGRYAKRVRDRSRRQHELDRSVEVWIRNLGGRPEGDTRRIALEALRRLTLLVADEFDQSGEPVTTEELARLALTIHRIESVGRLWAVREHARARTDDAGAGQAGRRRGLSEETAAAIRREAEGRVAS